MRFLGLRRKLCKFLLVIITPVLLQVWGQECRSCGFFGMFTASNEASNVHWLLLVACVPQRGQGRDGGLVRSRWLMLGWIIEMKKENRV